MPGDHADTTAGYALELLCPTAVNKCGKPGYSGHFVGIDTPHDLNHCNATGLSTPTVP